MTKSLSILPTIALLSLSAGACGGAGSGVGSASQPSSRSSAHGYMRYDEDAPTDDTGSRSDDLGRLHYGREATIEERRALTAVVRRYYAAASAGDGAGACALISSKLAKRSNLEQLLPKEYRPPSGSPVFRGKHCVQVESLLFGINHQQLVGEASTLQVIGTRVKGARGLVLLGFQSTGEREIPMVREGRDWKVDTLIDRLLP